MAKPDTNGTIGVDSLFDVATTTSNKTFTLKDANAPASFKQKQFMAGLLNYENAERQSQGLPPLNAFSFKGTMGQASAVIDNLQKKWAGQMAARKAENAKKSAEKAEFEAWKARRATVGY